MGEEEILLISLSETTKRCTFRKIIKKESQGNEALQCISEASCEAEETTPVTDERKLEEQENGVGQRKLNLKLRLSMVKRHIPKPDFSRVREVLHRPDFSRVREALHRPDFSRVREALRRADFSRFRGGLSNVNCFRVEEDEELPVMEIERHRSVDLGLRRTSLYFFRRKHSICQHPYHPYTPKQETRLIWNVHHFKT